MFLAIVKISEKLFKMKVKCCLGFLFCQQIKAVFYPVAVLGDLTCMAKKSWSICPGVYYQ